MVEVGEKLTKPHFVRQMIVASGNLNKVAELQTVAREFDLELLSPKVFAEKHGLGALPEVEETGDTYQENARLKAIAFALWAGIPALGDDSGLEVAALDNRPGVFSARYAGHAKSDRDRIEKLLCEYKQVSLKNEETDRTAVFHCSLALAYPDGACLSAESELEGYLLNEPRGNKGFGYDPVVYLYNLGCTLAEVDFEVTCRYGFRAVAARKLFSQLLFLMR